MCLPKCSAGSKTPSQDGHTVTSPGRLWGKIRTLGWFLARPRFYGQAIRAVRFRLFPHPGEQTA